jgi:ABC-2 type transport system ATP-binding protein
MVVATTRETPSSGPAIEARSVTKTFVAQSGRATSLKERLLRRGGTAHTFRALDEVSITIEHGHTVGLIGRNGSGKSTFLKVLAGIIRPTSGSVVTSGRISSLLELGAGFNGDLSGRDNVYLNASLLGLTRRETSRLFDSIVEFSELADFIDNPVKHYSSGMYVRLGFAVAVHVDPAILLVDEVLAVGDEAFARKCLAKIAEFQQDGRTILFVSHDLDLVEQICNRAVVLDHGAVVFDGAPSFATGTLRGLLGTDGPAPQASRLTPGVRFSEISARRSPSPGPVAELAGGDEFVIRVVVEVAEEYATKIASVAVVVMGAGNIPVWVMRADRPALPGHAGTWSLDFATVAPMIEGGFRIAVQAADEDDQPIAATESDDLLWVHSGHSAGLLKVPYDVEVAGT